jgi:Flp pilus assembly pilin Flp
MKKIGKNKKNKGQSLVEYGLILALVAVVSITVLQTVGTQIRSSISLVSTKLQQSQQLAGATP